MLNKPNNGPHTPTHWHHTGTAQWAIKAQTQNSCIYLKTKIEKKKQRCFELVAWLITRGNAITVTHLDLITNLETFIFEHQLLETFGQFDMMAYVML